MNGGSSSAATGQRSPRPIGSRWILQFATPSGSRLCRASRMSKTMPRPASARRISRSYTSPPSRASGSSPQCGVQTRIGSANSGEHRRVALGIEDGLEEQWPAPPVPAPQGGDEGSLVLHLLGRTVERLDRPEPRGPRDGRGATARVDDRGRVGDAAVPAVGEQQKEDGEGFGDGELENGE